MRYPLIVLAITALACRDRPSGLDMKADSLAAATPIAADTVRTSSIGGRRLEMIRDTIIEATPETSKSNYLRETRRMGYGSGKIALFSASELKVFDTAGKHLWSTSRFDFSPGQANAAKRSAFGPGRGPDVGDWIEFMIEPDHSAPGAIVNASVIRIHHDSIVVLHGSSLISIYNQVGRVLSIIGLPRDSGFYVSPTGLTPSNAGWLLQRSTGTVERGTEGRARVSHFIQRVSLNNGALGHPLRSEGVEATSLRIPAGEGSTRTLVGRPPFQPVPIAAVSNGMFFYTNGVDFNINAYDEFGRLKRVIEVEADRVPITEALTRKELDRISSSYRDRMSNGDSSAALWLRKVLPELEKFERPKFRPVAGAMWVGDDGSIAVRRNDLDPDLSTSLDSLIVDVLGADGKYRGRVAFEQPGLTILHFTGREFFVAERAGVASRGPATVSISSRGERITSPARPGQEIYYERLLRFEIRN